MQDFETELKMSVLDEMDSYLEEINKITSNIVENEIETQALNNLFRIVHTIKGNCKAAEFNSLSKISHLFEDLLLKLRNNEIQFSEKIKEITILYYDSISDAVEILKKNLSAQTTFANLETAIENVLYPQIKISDKQTKLNSILKKKILIIDDDVDFSNLISNNIKTDLKVEVEVAQNGSEALQLTEKKYYSVIICDYEMPLINGVEFIHKLRTHSGINKETYVIFTSAHEPKDLQTEDWENVVYLQKPISRKKIINYIRFGFNSLIIGDVS